MSAKQRKAPNSFPLTDSGNAELIAAIYGDRLRFNHCRGHWLIWKDGHWSEDAPEVFLMAKAAARARLRGADKNGTPEARASAAKWATDSESRYRLVAALELAKNEAPISDAGDEWDSEPFLLCVGNGIVDLHTGKLRNEHPEDRVTLHTKIVFDPSAKCPRFEQFLQEVFLQNEEMIRFVQKAIGYSLTGDVREDCLFLCYGTGANGKSTLLETMRYVLGAYAHNLLFSAFELAARSGIPNDIATLVSRRFVTAAETNENVQFNEARIKALTGGDKVTARFLYKEQFDFDPTAKFWLAFNHKPRVTDDSHGFWRRIRLIPFLAMFNGPQDDKTLRTKLRGEASGILAWAVQGCLLWQNEGLGMPVAVRQATAHYRSESDPLAAFFADRYELCSDGFVESATLLRDYVTWAEETGEMQLDPRAFATRLRARGLVNTRVGHLRKRGWRGLRQGVTAVLSADTRTDADGIIQ